MLSIPSFPSLTAGSPVPAEQLRLDRFRQERSSPGQVGPGQVGPSQVDPGQAEDTACAITTVIGGAAGRRRLHALHPARPGQEAAVTGFALALTILLEQSRAAPILWVQERRAQTEAGRPYGDGLAELGLDPARLVVVSVKGAMSALAAAEMGLEETGLAGVLVDLPERLPSDMLRLGKRLSLRAETRQTPCFLLHAGSQAIEAPVATRWQVASGMMRTSPGTGRRYVPPDLTTVFDLALTKNRFGSLGRFRGAWCPVAADVASVAPRRGIDHVPRFTFARHSTPLPEPMVASIADRPGGAAQPTPDAVVAWPSRSRSAQPAAA